MKNIFPATLVFEQMKILTTEDIKLAEKFTENSQLI